MAQGFGKHLLKALGYRVFGVIFFGLTASAFASATLDLLVNAAARFSAAIGQQLVIVQNDPAPADFAEKDPCICRSKSRLFHSTAGRDAGTDKYRLGERTSAAPARQVLLGQFSGNPDVGKARVKFERAQEDEETFHKDFDGIDFTILSSDWPRA